MFFDVVNLINSSDNTIQYKDNRGNIFDIQSGHDIADGKSLHLKMCFSSLDKPESITPQIHVKMTAKDQRDMWICVGCSKKNPTRLLFATFDPWRSAVHDMKGVTKINLYVGNTSIAVSEAGNDKVKHDVFIF